MGHDDHEDDDERLDGLADVQAAVMLGLTLRKVASHSADEEAEKCASLAMAIMDRFDAHLDAIDLVQTEDDEDDYFEKMIDLLPGVIEQADAKDLRDAIGGDEDPVLVGVLFERTDEAFRTGGDGDDEALTEAVNKGLDLRKKKVSQEARPDIVRAIVRALHDALETSIGEIEDADEEDEDDYETLFIGVVPRVVSGSSDSDIAAVLAKSKGAQMIETVVEWADAQFAALGGDDDDEDDEEEHPELLDERVHVAGRPHEEGTHVVPGHALHA